MPCHHPSTYYLLFPDVSHTHRTGYLYLPFLPLPFPTTHLHLHFCLPDDDDSVIPFTCHFCIIALIPILFPSNLHSIDIIPFQDICSQGILPAYS